MANYITTDTELTAVANAIRTKSGTSETISYPAGFVSAIENIPSGGSVDGDVIFLDYDGTIVDAKTKAEINAMTSDSNLPANPSHTGLTAQGWNWTVAQLKSQLSAVPDGKMFVGQMYVTSNGETKLYIHIEDTPCKTVPLNWYQSATNGVTINWGDGSATEKASGTGYKEVPHTYASAGDYTITMKVTSGSMQLGAGNTSVLGGNSSTIVYPNMLRSVEIGTGVTSIGDCAFRYCGRLTSVTIPSSVTSIGEYAFSNCYSIKCINVPKNVVNIDANAFYYCNSVERVTLPSGLKTIGNYGFYNCYSLTYIALPSSMTSIGNYAFCYCYSLADITMPSSMTSTIGNDAFEYCMSLKSISIPSGVTQLNNETFRFCYSLEKITIPSSMTQFTGYSGYEFANCDSLTTVELPENLTNINSYTFYYCKGLATLTVPASVTSIGARAFDACCGVAEYHILPTTPPTLGSNAFNGMSSNCVIYVPSASLSTYQSASGWSNYASHMQGE